MTAGTRPLAFMAAALAGLPLLAPGGTLIVADVIPPQVGAVSDGFALLRYARANGFLGAAILGLARTALSRYRRLRS